MHFIRKFNLKGDRKKECESSAVDVYIFSPHYLNNIALGSVHFLSSFLSHFFFFVSNSLQFHTDTHMQTPTDRSIQNRIDFEPNNNNSTKKAVASSVVYGFSVPLDFIRQCTMCSCFAMNIHVQCRSLLNSSVDRN